MICPYCKKEMKIVDSHCSECGHRIYNIPSPGKHNKKEEK